MNYKNAIGVLACLLVPSIAAAQVVVNEISICNVNKQVDPKYDYSGWIELYNTSSKDIDLKTLYFSDEEGNPLKYKLASSRVLPANGYQVVWLNDELLNSTTGYSMDVDADDGGIITVCDKDGAIYDTFSYGVQYPNVSFGRKVDGDVTSDYVYFVKDTYLASNNNASTATASEVITTPTFSVKSGFYSSSLNIEITCATEGAEIYYTTDCTEPTKSSTKY